MIYGCQWRHVREQHITTVTVLKETGLRHIDTYLERRRIRWAGHVARMGWHRTPRKLLSAWAYQEDGRSWGRPMKRWAESFEEAQRRTTDFSRPQIRENSRVCKTPPGTPPIFFWCAAPNPFLRPSQPPVSEWNSNCVPNGCRHVFYGQEVLYR